MFTVIALRIYLCDKQYENDINNFSSTGDLPDFCKEHGCPRAGRSRACAGETGLGRRQSTLGKPVFFSLVNTHPIIPHGFKKFPVVGSRLPSHKGRQRVQARPTEHLSISGVERDGDLVPALKRNGCDFIHNFPSWCLLLQHFNVVSYQ